MLGYIITVNIKLSNYGLKYPSINCISQFLDLVAAFLHPLRAYISAQSSLLSTEPVVFGGYVAWQQDVLRRNSSRCLISD